MAETDETPVELNISTETVCFIILKAREYDVKVEPVDADSGSNPGDDGERVVLEDLANDATIVELRTAIDDLNDDEMVDLIALAWVGRGDFTRQEWPEARALARERHRRRSSAYLLGMPALGDYLEEGLAALGHSCADFDRQVL